MRTLLALCAALVLTGCGNSPTSSRHSERDIPTWAGGGLDVVPHFGYIGPWRVNSVTMSGGVEVTEITSPAMVPYKPGLDPRTCIPDSVRCWVWYDNGIPYVTCRMYGCNAFSPD